MRLHAFLDSLEGRGITQRWRDRKVLEVDLRLGLPPARPLALAAASPMHHSAADRRPDSQDFSLKNPVCLNNPHNLSRRVDTPCMKTGSSGGVDIDGSIVKKGNLPHIAVKLAHDPLEHIC